MCTAVAIGIDLASVTVVSREMGNSCSLSPQWGAKSTICYLHCASFLLSHPPGTREALAYSPVLQLTLAGLGRSVGVQLHSVWPSWTVNCNWEQTGRKEKWCLDTFVCSIHFPQRDIKKWPACGWRGGGGGRGKWEVFARTYVGFFSFSSWWQWLMVSSESCLSLP
jgi:hypothetical protein